MDKKVALISTIMNEESSIDYYIESILAQTFIPHEIIIVDGGSTDGTIDKIKKYVIEGFPIKLILKNEINISQGRNIAIRNSESEIIVATDAGCKLDKDWVKNITEYFRSEDVDVVAGFYEANPKSFFEKCVSIFTMPTVENFNKYNPSSRSIAFTKNAWSKVNGYPEWLYTAEDSLFNIKLKEAGCKFEFAKNAVVYWRPRKNLIKLYKQYYLYAIGDCRANLITGHYIEKLNKYLMFFTILLTLYKNIFACVIMLYIMYSYWITRIKRVYNKLNDKRVYFYIPLIMTAMDIGKIFGFIVGKLYFYKDRK